MGLLQPPDEDLARTLMSADTLLSVSCSTNTTLVGHEGPPVPAETTCIHVSDDPGQVGRDRPADRTVVGSPGRVLRALTLDLTVVVPDSRSHRILKDNTLEVMGGAEEECEFVGIEFDPPVDLVRNAKSHGVRAELVETPEEIGPALSGVLDREGTDMLDVLVHD